MDRTTARMIREELEHLINAGLSDSVPIHEDLIGSVKVGSCIYGDGHATFKVEVTQKGGKTKKASDFDTYCHRYGLKPEDMGKEFESNGETFVICGLKPRSSKYPILGKSKENGSTYKFSPKAVLNHFRLQGV